MRNFYAPTSGYHCKGVLQIINTRTLSTTNKIQGLEEELKFLRSDILRFSEHRTREKQELIF